MSIKHAMAILVAGVAALSTVVTAQLPVPVPVKSKPVDPEPVEIIRTDFDPRELAEELERMRSKPEAPGQQLFVSRCAICHDPIGQPGSGETLGPWLDAELVSSKGEEAVRAAILNGTANMPGFRHQFRCRAGRPAHRLYEDCPGRGPALGADRGPDQRGALGNPQRAGHAPRRHDDRRER